MQMIIQLIRRLWTDYRDEEQVTIVLPTPQFVGREFELPASEVPYIPPPPGTRHMTYVHPDGTVTEEIL